MNETWWVSKDQLVGEQSAVINLPLDGSYLVVGPPGSGKTNLLLLRANFLHLAGHASIALIVFTRTLQEFLLAGAKLYDFPAEKIVTSVSWMTRLLREFGRPVPKEESFEANRAALTAAVLSLIEDRKLSNIYDAILLDEAQDYSIEELKIFRALAGRLFIVADSRQRIYEDTEVLPELGKLVHKVITLHYHFRNGIKICRVADAICEGTADFEALEPAAQYEESSKPSSVEEHTCVDLDEQIAKILEKLDIQRKAYPDELIGICCPKNQDVEKVWAALQASHFADVCVLHKSDQHGQFNGTSRICVATIHAAKGLEFRALHLAGLERLGRFHNQRNLAFTAVTRAKTSLSMYYTESIPTFLDNALNKLKPLPDLPKVSDAFGKSK